MQKFRAIQLSVLLVIAGWFVIGLAWQAKSDYLICAGYLLLGFLFVAIGVVLFVKVANRRDG